MNDLDLVKVYDEEIYIFGLKSFLLNTVQEDEKLDGHLTFESLMNSSALSYSKRAICLLIQVFCFVFPDNLFFFFFFVQNPKSNFLLQSYYLMLTTCSSIKIPFFAWQQSKRKSSTLQGNVPLYLQNEEEPCAEEHNVIFQTLNNSKSTLIRNTPHEKRNQKNLPSVTGCYYNLQARFPHRTTDTQMTSFLVKGHLSVLYCSKILQDNYLQDLLRDR